MFRTLMNRYATPFTTGLFLSSLISGVLLFFHVGGGEIHGMHEWLSMVLILPFVFHVVKNWRPILNYLRNGWLVWPLVISLVASLAFYVPTYLMPASEGSTSGNPTIVLANAFANGKIADVAPLLKKSPDVISAALEKAGIKVAADQTLNDMAKASGKQGRDAVFAVVSAR
jgi:hypothetical protein